MPPLWRAGQSHAPTLALKGPAPEAALVPSFCLELCEFQPPLARFLGIHAQELELRGCRWVSGAGSLVPGQEGRGGRSLLKAELLPSLAVSLPVWLVIPWVGALHTSFGVFSFHPFPLCYSRNPLPPFPHSCSGLLCSMGCDISNRD